MKIGNGTTLITALAFGLISTAARPDQKTQTTLEKLLIKALCAYRDVLCLPAGERQ